MLEKLSAQAIYYRPRANGPTGILNAGLEGACLQEKIQCILNTFW